MFGILDSDRNLRRVVRSCDSARGSGTRTRDANIRVTGPNDHVVFCNSIEASFEVAELDLVVVRPVVTCIREWIVVLWYSEL
jgi:hypothetical protein